MDFSEYTLGELYKIYYSLQLEMFKRQWWLYLLLIILTVIFVIVWEKLKKKYK